MLLKQHAQDMATQETALTGKLLSLWQQLDLRDVDSSWASFAFPARKQLMEHGTMVNVLGESFFDAHRFLSGAPGRAPAWVPKVIPEQQLTTVLDVTGRVGLKVAQRQAGSLQAAGDTAFVKVSGAAQRLVRSSERAGLLQTAAHDPAHPKWQRIVSSSQPCRFCRMLAGRGAVYHEQATADFKAHDHCNCGTVAVYPGADPLPPGTLAMRPEDLIGDLNAGDALTEWTRQTREDMKAWGAEEAAKGTARPFYTVKGMNPVKDAKSYGLILVRDYVNWVRRGGRDTIEEYRKYANAGKVGRYGVLDTTPRLNASTGGAAPDRWNELVALVRELQKDRATNYAQRTRSI